MTLQKVTYTNTWWTTHQHGPWFQSYLVWRRQFVRTGSSTSSLALILCSVPQGSVLGPILFLLLYTADLLLLIGSHGLRPQLYADDTQVYGLCRPPTTLELQNIISTCIDDVARWMRSNRLQLNTAKTEVLWSTSSRRLHLLPVSPIQVGSDQVKPVSVVRNLSIYMDADVSTRSHVSKTVAACFAILRQLRSIRRSVPRSVLQSFCSGWTMVMQRWLAFHPTSPSGCSRCRILLLGLCFSHRGTTASRHFWHSCTGWRCRSASSLSWLFWYAGAYTRQLRRTSLRNSTSHLLTRLVSVSALLRHHRLLSDAHVFQPSVIELSRSLLLLSFLQWTRLTVRRIGQTMYSNAVSYVNSCMQRRVRKFNSRVVVFRFRYIDGKLCDKQGVMC